MLLSKNDKIENNEQPLLAELGFALSVIHCIELLTEEAFWAGVRPGGA
jgi:hypothetical protein